MGTYGIEDNTYNEVTSSHFRLCILSIFQSFRTHRQFQIRWVGQWSMLWFSNYCIINLGHPPDLNSLLHLLQGQVTSKWIEFGQALGVPKKILDQLTDYSEEDGLVEVLDYWLTHHPNQPTWQEVSDAQDKINVYKKTKTNTIN